MVGSGDTIGDRIAEIRGQETEASFAAKHGVHKNTLRRYEANDRGPDKDFLLSLTRSGHNANWILTGKGSKWLPPDLVYPQELMLSDIAGDDRATAHRAEQPAGARLREIEGTYAAGANLVMVPHLGIEAGAGPGRYAVSMDGVGELAFRLDYLRRAGINPKDAGLATVRGFSMVPKLHDGDIVLVDRAGKEIRGGGKCFVFRQADEIVVKYLAKLPDGSIQATSENPAFPPYIVVPDGVNVEIIGRVRADTHEWD